MKKVMFQFTSFFLALLVLVSSIGVNLSGHYCQGKLVSYAFFGNAKSCYEIAGFDKPAKSISTLPSPNNQNSIQKRNCCDDQHNRFQLDQDNSQQGDNLTFQQAQLKAIPSYHLNATSLHKKPYSAIYFDAYKPPLIRKDISVLHQSFLL